MTSFRIGPLMAASIAPSTPRPASPLVREHWSSDEHTKEALIIRVDRKLNSTNVLDALTDLFILGDPPEYIRSDNVLCSE